jgi:hypothetical protein
VDLVVLAKVTIVAILPNVATAGVEECVVPPAIRELDTGEVSIRQSGLGLKDWFHYDYRKKQSDDCEDSLRIKVNAHVSNSNLFWKISGLSKWSIFEANSTNRGGRIKSLNFCEISKESDCKKL